MKSNHTKYETNERFQADLEQKRMESVYFYTFYELEIYL